VNVRDTRMYHGDVPNVREAAKSFAYDPPAANQSNIRNGMRVRLVTISTCSYARCVNADMLSPLQKRSGLISTLTIRRS
jgi:hypothetical protein